MDNYVHLITHDNTAGNTVVGSVGNVFYFADDLPAAVQWYHALLGFGPVLQHARLSVFEVGATRLTVHETDEYNSSAGTSGSVAYWDVVDVDAIAAGCVARGGVIHRGPKTVFSGQRLCQVVDPFGNLIGFRQIVMTPAA